jgi:hypothetical protein
LPPAGVSAVEDAGKRDWQSGISLICIIGAVVENAPDRLEPRSTNGQDVGANQINPRARDTAPPARRIFATDGYV